VITGATVVYLSASDWDALWHGPQEVAVRLGAAGNRVIYVETLGWRRPRAFDLPRIARRLRRALGARAARGGRPARRPAPGVEVVSPLLVPGPVPAPVRAANRRALRRMIAPRVAGHEGPLVLWVYTPSRLSVELVGAFGEDLAVYHCTQGHAQRPLAPPDTAAMEDRLMSRVGAVVVDGIELYRERVARHPHVYRIPSGVNVDDHGDVAPASWAAGLRRPVVGYMGHVNHRVDPALLAAVARARPDWTVLVVGPVSEVAVDDLAALPNVVMHGRVPIEEVPAALAAFDVGVMPYADIPMNRYCYPAKLHQYLAAGLPIASVPLPDLEEFAGLVETGSGPEGLLAAIERALAGDRRAEERRAVAARNTWEHRMDALSRVVEGHLGGAPPPSDPGLS
jgi:UDP-galactopyranose mutase